MTKIIKNVNQSVQLQEYLQALLEIKQRIQQGQVKALTFVNADFLKMYWDIDKIKKLSTFNPTNERLFLYFL